MNQRSATTFIAMNGAYYLQKVIQVCSQLRIEEPSPVLYPILELRPRIGQFEGICNEIHFHIASSRIIVSISTVSDVVPLPAREMRCQRFRDVGPVVFEQHPENIFG